MQMKIEEKNKHYKVEEVEKQLLSHPQLTIPVKHTFSEGMYAREIEAPKGAMMVGHKHNVSCLNILVKGSILIKSTEEDEGQEIHAPNTFNTDPGSRKIVYVLEDMIFINVFKTDTRDLDVLEDELITKSGIYLENKSKEKKCLG